MTEREPNLPPPPWTRLGNAAGSESEASPVAPSAVEETQNDDEDDAAEAQTLPERAADPRTEELSERREIVRAALRQWQDQLIDVSGRNRLLYLRELTRGTLNLGPDSDADGDVSVEIRRGRKVKLSACFPDDEGKDAIRRAQWIYRKAREYEQERGIHALRLGCLFATWENPGSGPVPKAPVLLAPAILAQLGRLEGDFTLSVADEWEINPSVVHLLKQGFGAEVDESALGELLSSEPLDEVAVADFLRSAYAGVPGFDISDGLVLSTFAYTKEPMVHDLEAAEDAVVNHPLVAAIAGDTQAQRELRDAQHNGGGGTEALGGDNLPPQDEFLILDADGTQSEVINAAVAGANLVVVGPPGTGKSQTIANLLATLTARGRSTLFVAEKRAAIDAVVNRLNNVGLGDLVLDLHEGTRSRRQTAEQLASALETAHTARAPDTEQLQRVVVRTRERLTHAKDELHRQRKPWDLSIYDLQSRILGNGGLDNVGPPLRGSVLEALSGEAVEQAVDELREYVNLGGHELDASDDAPWAPAHRGDLIDSQERLNKVVSLLDDLTTFLIRDVERELVALVEPLDIEPPASPVTASRLLEMAADFEERREHLTPAIFEVELDELIEQLRPAESGVLGRLVAHLSASTYRAAKRLLPTLLRTPSSVSPAQTRQRLIGFADLRDRWVQEVGGEFAANLWELESLACRQALERFSAALAEFSALTGLEDDSESDWAAQSEQLERFQRERTVAFQLLRLRELRLSLERRGLTPITREAAESGWGGARAAQVFEAIWTRSVLEAVRGTAPTFAAFDATGHDDTVAEFCNADREHIEISSKRVLRAWAEAVVAARDERPEQSQLIVREARKKRRHLPTRDLFQQAPDVLTALKPCWVMSPLVVAQLLPLGSEPPFDVVVFDEASQIPPADAVSSLLRGRQAIVAGDPKQLPPTSFFASSSEDEDEENDQDAPLTQDVESILDTMSTLLLWPWGSRTLGWHYRSKDERLIAFSNHHVYDRRLTTFPGALPDDCLAHVEVPFEPDASWVSGSYAPEVRRVVELILRHAAERPDETLGVIALGSTHADRIAEALRDDRRDRPELDDFFSEANPEPFFVKNIERVQGDERDAIILTVGYGRTEDGRMRYNFGPINQKGGFRRLNVAITRAKRRMTVVSCFSHEDMDPDRLNNEGVRRLRDYIEYAAGGGRKLGAGPVNVPPLNPFEIDIRDRLEARGLKLQPQYGVSGYRIDFAAMHPDEPGRPILAIEADGAQYHSTQAARDRDRLRQDHLQRLGWRFHRIWSTEWFRNPEFEADRALAAYQRALAADRSAPSSAPPEELPAEPPEEPPPPPSRGRRPRIPPGKKIDDYSPRQLIRIIQWIESDGRLRAEDELLAEAMQELGFKRRDTKIVAALTEAIRRAR